MGAEQDPDDPKAYIEAYQEGLFKKTNKVAIKRRIYSEALEENQTVELKLKLLRMVYLNYII